MQRPVNKSQSIPLDQNLKPNSVLYGSLNHLLSSWPKIISSNVCEINKTVKHDNVNWLEWPCRIWGDIIKHLEVFLCYILSATNGPELLIYDQRNGNYILKQSSLENPKIGDEKSSHETVSSFFLSTPTPFKTWIMNHGISSMKLCYLKC